jgi:hypothetical protein
MLANWSSRRFWDCVVSTQRDFWQQFSFLWGLKKAASGQKILIFHVVRASFVACSHLVRCPTSDFWLAQAAPDGAYRKKLLEPSWARSCR